MRNLGGLALASVWPLWLVACSGPAAVGDTDVVDTGSNDTDLLVEDTDTGPVTCPTGPVIVGNVRVTTDAEITALNCVTRITGSLTIQGAEIRSIADLTLLASIGGDLFVQDNLALTSLDGLAHVESIGGTLHIDGNPVLANLQGLGGLEDVASVQVGGGLHIGDCPALTSLEGLGGLTSVGGYLDVHHNTSLTTLFGLEALTSVTGNIYVEDNPVLCDADIDRLVGQLGRYAGSVARSGNGVEGGAETFCGVHVGDVLAGDVSDLCLSHLNLAVEGDVDLTGVADLTGLACVNRISGDLLLRCNPSLKTLRGLENLLSVGGDLQIVADDQLYNLEGLGSLQAVGGDVLVTRNRSLQNLSGTDARGAGSPVRKPGLDALTGVGGDVSLGGVDDRSTCSAETTVGNPTLRDLEGLKTLATVGGSLIIEDELGLTSLSGLQALHSLGASGGLTLRRNDALTSLTGLEGIALAFDVDVSENATLTKLQGLEALTSVNTLTVRDNPALVSLFPVARLGAVGATVDISGNPSLSSLVGLDELRSVGADLIVDHNTTLPSLLGLQKLYSVGGMLRVAENDALVTLRGLDGVRSVTAIEVRQNASLCDADVDRLLEQVRVAPTVVRVDNKEGTCAVWPATGQGTVITGGFSNLCTGALWNLTIRGGVNIGPRETVADVAALWCVTHIEGDLSVRSSTLSTLDAVDSVGRHGLAHLVEIGGTLEVRADNSLLGLSGLGALRTVGVDVDVEDNLNLRNLVGLDSLTQVGGLRVSGNDAITSLAGLSALTDVTGRLFVADNASLATLSGLDSLGHVGGAVTVTANPSLCASDLDAFVVDFPTCACGGGTTSTCLP